MATKRPAKPRRTLLQEAADPSTDPERLRRLADHEDKAVRQATWRNPSLPEKAWRRALLAGYPEAWANPVAPLYVLTWTPREGEAITLDVGARWATEVLWREPERCSLEGKALLTAKVQEWWATSEEADDMMSFLGWWANVKGDGSFEHREAVRILLLCVRTTPDLTDNDQKALNLLEAWTGDGQDRRKKAEDLADCMAVTNTVRFAQNPRNNAWYATNEVLNAFEREQGEEYRTEHEHLLANLIRQEIPMPPGIG